MYTQILPLLEGARRARGLTVVIDVFRAFSTACYVHANGADIIRPVAKLEEAYALKKTDPEAVLMGERDCIRQPGFDYGNSPADIEDVDFTGKSVVHTTSAGTQGLAAAYESADEVITGSFVNADAIMRYIREKQPKIVSLVCMGTAGRRRSAEDELCAMYLKNGLEGFPNSIEAITRHLRTIESAEKFFDPQQTHAPERDFDLCLALDRFDFVLKVNRDDKSLFLEQAGVHETA